MAVIGYARTSTLDQVAGLDAQVRDLEKLGCDKVYSERVSSVAERPQLQAALDYARDGDVFVVTKLDRLARSTGQLLSIVERLKGKGVELRILDLGIDTATATGKMMLTIIGAIAEFERRIMLERQREGIAAARSAGKYKGRIPTARRQGGEVLRLHGEGVRAGDIARRLGIGRASVYRIIAEAPAVLAEAAD